MTMKRFFLAALLCLHACAACAEAALPDPVARLLADVHPGYAIAAHDGWGDDARGQFAVILQKGEDNILCIAEKDAKDSAYSLTIDNTDAVCDGSVLPSLLIDSGGDSLWYTYVDMEEGSSVHYNAFKANGQWGSVGVLAYWPREDGMTGMMSGVSEGRLFYEETDEDENENVRDRRMYAPVWATPAFSRSMELAHFNIHTFDADPRDGLYPLTKNPAFMEGRGSPGDTLEDLDISDTHRAELCENAQGDRYLCISDWDGENLVPVQVLGRSEGACLDTYHAGSGEVLITDGTMSYSILRADVCRWYLTGTDHDGVRRIGPDYAAPAGRAAPGRNDGYVYGDSPWGDFLPGRINLPTSFEEAYAQLDQSAYALVHNPNPKDRLHLRGAPDKDAYSYGKFYNRTPVRVLRKGETWTKVQVGTEGRGFTGYMMTKYLAFGEKEKAALVCAFPQKHLKEEYKPGGARMLSAPSRNAESCGMFAYGPDDFIIGVSGEEWYVVLRADGTVGYVLQSAFWDGNG
ncbi:MAG: hypothetical protein IJE71_07445 [Clostridia bacterium]|nr:hypothetical protein [Clostridia bacterium]